MMRVKMKKDKRNVVIRRPVQQLRVSHIGVHGMIGAVAWRLLQHLVQNHWILEAGHAEDDVLKTVAVYFKRNVQNITEAKIVTQKRLVEHPALHTVSNCLLKHIYVLMRIKF